MNIAQINIELTSRCNRQTKCGFCGHQDQAVNPKPQGDMDFALLWKISTQIPEGCIVSFHRDGDPLAYPRLGDALKLFKNHPTSIVTHGETLGDRAAEIIGNCTTVTVSVIPNDKDRDTQLASLQAFLAQKGDRRPQVQVKCVGVATEPYNGLGVPVIGRALHSKKGNWNYQVQPAIPEVRVCLDFLHKPTIDWRGRLFVCNRLDVKDDGLIGDLNYASLQELWNGPKRRNMLQAHMTGHREQANALCASCHYWGIPAC